MPTTASRASPTSGSGRPVRLGASCTVGSSGGSAMRRCGRSASRRAFSRGSTRGRRAFAAAGVSRRRRGRPAGAALTALPGGACATARSAPAVAGRCGRRAVVGASPVGLGCRCRSAVAPPAPSWPAFVRLRRRLRWSVRLRRRVLAAPLVVAAFAAASSSRAFCRRPSRPSPSWPRPSSPSPSSRCGLRARRLLRRGVGAGHRLGDRSGHGIRRLGRHDRLGADERGGTAPGPLPRRAGGAGGQGSLTCGHQ